MICPHCGKENPDGAEICQHCGEPLPPAGKPPRLLSQIQGLIPAEPVITSGALHDPAHRVPASLLPEHLSAPERGEAPQPEGTPAAAIAAGAAAATVASETPDDAPASSARPARAPTFVSSPSPEGRSYALPIIAGIFFLLILFGSLWNLMAAAEAPLRPSVKNAYAFIEILPPNARVLLAWDYDPATQGEIQLLAQPILQHLRRKGARMAFMSLRPFGPNVADDALALSNRLRPLDASAGPPPASFGFIPGESAALRSLTLSPVIASNRPAMSAQSTGLHPAQTIDAFDLIIEFSSDVASAQEWVEQTAARSQTPLLVAASGAAAPALRPYEQTRQIKALLSGYPDALAYEILLGQKGPAYAQTTAQTLALLALLGVIFLAAFRSLLVTTNVARPKTTKTRRHEGAKGEK